MARLTAPKMVQVTWGKRVKAARTRNGYSQATLADRVGVDQSTISRIETGDYRQLNPELLLRLCLALDMDPDQDFSWPTAILEFARRMEPAA